MLLFFLIIDIDVAIIKKAKTTIINKFFVTSKDSMKNKELGIK